METISQTFDFGRFGKCLMRELKLNCKAWLLRMLLMFGVTTILLIIATHPHHISPEDYGALQSEGSFLISRLCAFVFCGLGASLFMENMTSNGLRLNSIMSPVSQLEKFATRFTICIVFVTLAYLLCYTLADVVRVMYVRTQYGDLPNLHFFGWYSVMRMAESKWFLWSYFFAMQMTFVLGSTVWPKNSFLKTFGTVVVICLVFMYAAINLDSYFGPQGPCAISHSACVLLKYWIANYAPLIWSAFCLITSYYRFKESEIINRF